MKKITNLSDTVLIDPNEPLILPDGTALVGRIEWFLYALCCLDYQNLPTPMSRIEEFANALITGEIPNIEPQSRAEQFFLAILDGNVSNLPQPQSRSEVLLDKLARGEFDLSDVEPIQSHYELLLAYLIKNGGIGNIDYVLYEFSEAMKTMYNTVEKPFKSLELSGNTLVNRVLEDTENDDYTSFDEDYSGTSFTINGTSEGAIKSAILKGQTLVNLIDLSRWGEQEKITFVSDGTSKRIEIGTDLPIKPNTKYLTIIPIYENTINNNFTLGGWDYYTDQPRITVADGTGIIKIIKTTKDVFSGNHFYLELWQENTSGQITFGKPMFIEYQDGMENWDIPYFEGMQSVKMPVLTTTGKNLLSKESLRGYHQDIKEIDGWLIADNGDFGGNIISKALIEKGKSYTLSTRIKTFDGGTAHYCFSHHGENDFNYLGGNKPFNGVITFTATETTYIDVWLLRNKITGSVHYSDVQLEEGSVATSYEPHKSNILSCNEEVTLRGIGDVKDTLDCLTGEVTERIGEVVLDGSESWVKRNDGDGSTTMSFTYVLSKDFVGTMNGAHAICDKFQISNSTMDDIEGFGMEPTTKHLYFEVSRTKASSLDEWKSWLSNNNVTIQYELAIPTIKTVDLNVVDQNNTKIDKMHVFNETTHINALSDELTPTVNIGKSVSYPTIIKPNTKYTVDLKRNDKPLTVNLGGTEVTFTSGETRKTITTPSILTNDKLSYYGVGAKCSEIMLIEGEVERNVDYFTGMQSVKLPVLTTTGKNLWNGVLLPQWCDTNGSVSDNVNTRIIKMKVEPNTKYTVSRTETGNRLDIIMFSQEPVLGSNTVVGNALNSSSNTDATTFTTTSETHWIIIRAIDNVANYTESVEFQIEFGNRTPHEPYKSSILSCNDDVTLRGTSAVQDELDLLSGEVTQRIGEIVLDGSDDEDWTVNGYNGATVQNTVGFIISLPNMKKEALSSIINNRIPSLNVSNYTNYIIGMCVIVNNDIPMLHIRLSSEITGNNLLTFKQWLSQNPITVQYPLKEKSIKTVDLNVVDQDGNTIPKIKSYNNVTHLEVTIPKQSLLPNISAEVATDNSKDMSSLTIKHQEINETQLTIEDNIQSQSDEIDTALMATTEIFESILE